MGQAILRGLLADKSVAAVHTLGRRISSAAHPKLTQHVVDFAALPVLPAATELYLALGTTIKVAGSQPAFRAIDFEANLAVAKAARQQGTRRVGLVSAMGANANSSLFYNRVKGDLEDALASLGFDALIVARPSFLVGDRAVLGQPLRSGEKFAMHLSEWLKPLIPANLRAIKAEKVAATLLQQVPARTGHHVALSGSMQA